MSFDPSSSRHVRPTTRKALWNWTWLHTGVRVARRAVCCGHDAPFDAYATVQLDRPDKTLILGSRGSGKSFLSSIDLHLDSRFNPHHQARILGGSKAQSKQVHGGLAESVLTGVGPFGSSDKDQIRKLGVEAAHYVNGSEIEILTASPLSVRGPHVPSLKMDEVDEIDPELREAAMGMCMAKRGMSAKLTMTSTWHNLGGPMSELVEKARHENVERPGSFPFYQFCVFEVLERCTPERSGPWVGGKAGYANCPQCPIKRWCHAEREQNGNIPLAKLSDGHYAIDSFAQKVGTVSERILNADYLCRGPKADGVWFDTFEEHVHVSERAEFNPAHKAYFGLDTGVHTGGLWFQVVPFRRGATVDHELRVFGDYYGEFLTPEVHVRGKDRHKGILETGRELCGNNLAARYTDPAGNARNASGTVTLGEFASAGLHMTAWPKVSIRDGLTLIEAMMRTADGTVRFYVHPRCVGLISALKNYRRAKKNGVWQDYPEDPQHPHENYVDALRSSVVAVMGTDGHLPKPVFDRVPIHKVM